MCDLRWRPQVGESPVARGLVASAIRSALASVGVNVSCPDDFSDMVAINQALAHTTFIQIFKAS